MKLLASIFLIFSHLFSTVGFSMAVHECGSQKSYSFYGISLHNKCKCDHKNKNHTDDCCKDKHSVVKGENKDKLTNKVFFSKKVNVSTFAPSSISFDVQTVILRTVKPEIYRSEFPPGNAPPLYILFRNILI